MANIPLQPVHFEDRTAEQKLFHQVVHSRGHNGLLIANVVGVDGVGRTTLAFRLALTQCERSVDGVIHVNLDDHRVDGGVDRSAVLGALLRGLGVRGKWRKGPYKKRREQYEKQTRELRLVVVLDNVRTGTELVGCLPTGPDSVVFAVSRQRLADFTNPPVLDLPVAPLEEQDAVRLLQHLVKGEGEQAGEGAPRLTGDPRLTGEPAAVSALVRACGGLPAALHIAAGWLRGHRRSSIARLLAELEGLEGKGLSMVEAVWTASYEGLGEGAAALYRALAVHPGPYLTEGAAAALLGAGKGPAGEALDELEGAGLLLPDVAERRMLRLPDLLRDHAAHVADRDNAPGEATAAREGLLRWYVRQARRADEAAAGRRMTFGAEIPLLRHAPDVPFKDEAAAMAWLEEEHLVLFGCVRTGYAHALDAETWALCEPLWTFHLDHLHPTETTEAFRIGLAAARRSGDARATARMGCQLARLLWEQEEYGQAGEELAQAAVAAATTADRKLHASVAEFRGKLLAVQKQWEASLPYFEESRHVHREIGNDYGVMLQTYLLGCSARGMGDQDRAAALLDEAHTEARSLRRERMTARTGFALGQVLHTLGRTGETWELYEAALASARRRGSTFDEARVHDALAALATETGDTERAATHAESATAIRKAAGALEP
ncbi:NB-ARC domain-containing protein [Streptomyces sp. NPDC021093]|uniref:NB-ARC domain-containing protein n=1 Tax=Streptomyces sp. NPDC021093 TaxID=3365112 RepID=UPI0037BB66D6